MAIEHAFNPEELGSSFRRPFWTMTRAESHALKRVYDRGPIAGPDGIALTYRAFRRLALFYSHVDCWIVPWHGMILGIERDGYTHS